MAYTKEINVAWEYKIIELDEAPTGDFQQARLAPRKAPTTESINDLEILIIREPASKHLRAEPLYPGPDEPDEAADANGKIGRASCRNREDDNHGGGLIIYH